jgi:hypothetical protein
VSVPLPLAARSLPVSTAELLQCPQHILSPGTLQSQRLCAQQCYYTVMTLSRLAPGEGKEDCFVGGKRELHSLTCVIRSFYVGKGSFGLLRTKILAQRKKKIPFNLLVCSSLFLFTCSRGFTLMFQLGEVSLLASFS